MSELLTDTDPTSTFLTLAQVAARWHCSTETVRNLMKKGLRGHRLGAWRFTLADVMDFEEKRATKPKPKNARRRRDEDDDGPYQCL